MTTILDFLKLIKRSKYWYRCFLSFPNFEWEIENNNELAYHITNIDLKSLCIRNLKKIAVGHLNINSIINRFDFLAHQIFIEINSLSKKKRLLSCSYNPTKMQISNHLSELSKSTDLYLTKYDQLLNAGIEDSFITNFCASYNLI